MLILGFDVETTGLALDWQKPSHPGQPHLVQLGCSLTDDLGKEHAYASLVIRPDGYAVPVSASNVHGIPHDLAMEIGIPLIAALAIFNHFAKIAQVHVGHNISFDIKVLMAAFHRANRPFPVLNPRCTKDLADPIMKMPPTEKMVAAGFGHKSKPPKLTECYQFFFNEELVGAHDALVDARGSLRVFFEVEKRRAQDALAEASHPGMVDTVAVPSRADADEAPVGPAGQGADAGLQGPGIPEREQESLLGGVR